jgi:pyruvate dehydrogenase E2 component (dihydrolipoamide acetyltransferase)
MEVVGYEEGTLLYVGVEAGKAAKINEIIAIVGKPGTDVSAYIAAEKSGANAGGQPQAASAQPQAEAAPVATNDQPATTNPQGPADDQPAATNGRVKASPLAKKLAAEKGIDISKVNGSGDGGRVTKKDVDSYVPAAAPAQQTPAAAAKPAAQAAAFTATGQEGFTDVPLTQMRKVIARRLGESKFSAPHFYLTMEINMDNAMTARVAMNEVSPVKISFNDMIIKASAMALRKHPDVNSSWMGEFIRQNHHVHIGSALALPEGLIVPVIRFADQKTLSQIAADAKELYGKAKDKKLQPAEFSGNTFTISNLGMMDIEEFTAIINPPDSAILAVGAIKEKVVKKGDGFAVTNIMKLTLSCDHRSVDGAVGAAFLQTLKKFLENPVTMLV